MLQNNDIHISFNFLLLSQTQILMDTQEMLGQSKLQQTIHTIIYSLK